VLPDSQAGFRKGRDNVYILDHLTRNELRKKGGGDVRIVRRLQGGVRQG
jgi:hypothetical protein